MAYQCFPVHFGSQLFQQLHVHLVRGWEDTELGRSAAGETRSRGEPTLRRPLVRETLGSGDPRFWCFRNLHHLINIYGLKFDHVL